MAIPRSAPPIAPPPAPINQVVPQEAGRKELHTTAPPSPPPKYTPPAPPVAPISVDIPFDVEDEQTRLMRAAAMERAEESARQAFPDSVRVSTGLTADTASKSLGLATTTSDLVAAAASYGFAGVDLDSFGVVPVISLHKETFKSYDGTMVLGDAFFVRCYGGREKFVYKTNLAQDDPRNDLFYTFDGVTVAGSGELVSERLDAWNRAGLPSIRKDYRDVNIGILRSSEDPDPLLAVLSVPPTSLSNYSGLALQLVTWSKMTGGNPADRIIKVFTGPLVTKVKFPFYPIKFEVMPADFRF